MTTEASEQVMALLKELSMIKEADTAPEEGLTKSEREEHNRHQRRKEEILEEIKALADEKKNDEPT